MKNNKREESIKTIKERVINAIYSNPQAFVNTAFRRGWIDINWFKEFYVDYCRYVFIDDIEDVATSKQLEQLEKGEISENDLRLSIYLENLLSIEEEGYTVAYDRQFGYGELENAILQNDLMDVDTLSSYIITTYGIITI